MSLRAHAVSRAELGCFQAKIHLCSEASPSLGNPASRRKQNHLSGACLVKSKNCPKAPWLRTVIPKDARAFRNNEALTWLTRFALSRLILIGQVRAERIDLVICWINEEKGRKT